MGLHQQRFLSIVVKARTPGCLVVRARGAERIEAPFRWAEVLTPGNDILAPVTAEARR